MMTEQQILKTKALARCSFLPASYEKRFVKDMANIASSEKAAEYSLSEKQAAYLDKLFHRYRNQHKLKLSHEGEVIKQLTFLLD